MTAQQIGIGVIILGCAGAYLAAGWPGLTCALVVVAIVAFLLRNHV